MLLVIVTREHRKIYQHVKYPFDDCLCIGLIFVACAKISMFDYQGH